MYACGKPHHDERLTDLLSCHFGPLSGKIFLVLSHGALIALNPMRSLNIVADPSRPHSPFFHLHTIFWQKLNQILGAPPWEILDPPLHQVHVTRIVLISPMIGWFLEEVGTDLLVFGDVFRHVLGVSSHLLQKLPQLTAKETVF